jgi:hypothetical protein
MVDSKSSQAGQSRPKLPPNFSKKKALISFDLVFRIELFQVVMVTPKPKIFLLSISSTCPASPESA